MHEHDHDHHHHLPSDAHSDEHCWYKGGPFVDELTSHLPFSVLSVAVGLILAGMVCFFTTPQMLAQAEKVIATHSAEHQGHDHDHEPPEAVSDEAHLHSGYLVLFHLFHPAHMLFSAAATAAMFFRYDSNMLKALLVGFTGAVLVCGISDILMPYLGALILGQDLELHICVLRHPMLVLPFAAIGVLVGMLAASGGTVGSTIFSHSLHVFASSMASIFFLIGPFEQLEWINHIGAIFFFVCVAVMVPCCLSDIVYPLLFTARAREQFARHGHHHPH